MKFLHMRSGLWAVRPTTTTSIGSGLALMISQKRVLLSGVTTKNCLVLPTTPHGQSGSRIIEKRLPLSTATASVWVHFLRNGSMNLASPMHVDLRASTKVSLLHKICKENPVYVAMLNSANFSTLGRSCNVNDLFILNAEFDSCDANASVPYKTTFNMVCHPGYVITGSANVTCQADGTWSEIPVCQSGCNPAPFVNNSEMIGDIPPYLTGNEVMYICKDGHYTNDFPSRTHFKMTCSEHSKWTSDHNGCYPFSSYDASTVELVAGQATILPCLVDESKIKMSNNSNDKIPVKTWMWLKDSENVESVFPGTWGPY